MDAISPKFDPKLDVRQLFASESLIRQNRHAFQQSIYEMFAEKELPLSHLAMDMYLTEVQGSDKDMRKDKFTPRQLHEQSHINAFSHLFDEVGTDWIKPEEYGSLDAFFAAVALHDIIEDFNLSPNAIRSQLKSGLENLFSKNAISEEEYHRGLKDIEHTLDIVICLSRTDEMGKKIAENDRIAQAKKWLNHPYAMPIKLVDWSNKLQTMVGVEHFQKDNYARMRLVLDETSLLFVDEQQGFTNKAIKKYPFIAEACQPLEGIMGMLFQTLNTYQKLKIGRFSFDPQEAYSFNFEAYLNKSMSFLARLPTGNNYIGPMVERLENIAADDPQTASFLKHMLLPSFANQQEAILQPPHQRPSLT